MGATTKLPSHTKATAAGARTHRLVTKGKDTHGAHAVPELCHRNGVIAVIFKLGKQSVR